LRQEKESEINFFVNDGINVKTFEEFQDAVNTSSGKAINIVNLSSNKLIPEFITNNDQNSANITTVNMATNSGKLFINGNGYEIDLSNLQRESISTKHLDSFLKVSTTSNIDNFVKLFDKQSRE
jgi:hypothetical protein